MYDPNWFLTYTKKGRPLPFKTVEEARQACHQAPGDSEEHLLAMSRWYGLSLLEAEKAKSSTEASRVFNNAHPKSRAYRLARDKWDDYASVDARNASTLEEARKAHNFAREGSKAESIAFEQWDKFSLALVEAAATVEECKAALESCPRWVGRSEARVRAQEKWDEIILQMLKRARSHKRASDILELSREKSQARKIAAAKVNSLYKGKKEYGDDAVYLAGSTWISWE